MVLVVVVPLVTVAVLLALQIVNVYDFEQKSSAASQIPGGRSFPITPLLGVLGGLATTGFLGVIAGPWVLAISLEIARV